MPARDFANWMVGREATLFRDPPPPSFFFFSFFHFFKKKFLLALLINQLGRKTQMLGRHCCAPRAGKKLRENHLLGAHSRVRLSRFIIFFNAGVQFLLFAEFTDLIGRQASKT